MAVGPDGRLYVIDPAVGLDRIDVVGGSGGVASGYTAINSVGDARDLAFDSAGNLWVTEINGTVSEFQGPSGSTPGAFIGSFVTLDGSGVRVGGGLFGIAIGPTSAVPEPGALWLLGSGLIGLVAWARARSGR